MADIDEKTSRFECGSEGSLNEDSGGCGARGDCHGESSCGESSGSGVCENSCANETEESSLAVVAEGGCGACESVCVSLQNGSISSGARERAIVIRPLETVEG